MARVSFQNSVKCSAELRLQQLDIIKKSKKLIDALNYSVI